MKIRFIVPMMALLAIGSPAAVAQTAGGTGSQQTPSTQQMDQRFEQMGTMMGQAQNAHGPQRIQLMRKHMQLMQEQMQTMHSMMGGMAGGGMGANGMMGGSGSSGGKGNADMLGHMQTRMDMMQRMMEQMLDQQKLMMQSAPTK